MVQGTLTRIIKIKRESMLTMIPVILMVMECHFPHVRHCHLHMFHCWPYRWVDLSLCLCLSLSLCLCLCQLYNITSVVHKQYTNIYPLLSFYLYIFTSLLTIPTYVRTFALVPTFFSISQICSSSVDNASRSTRDAMDDNWS